jgi:predicted lipoprotein with Yx(FWY)xxD motif
MRKVSILVVLVGLVAGCASPAATPTPTVAPTPTASLAPTPTATLAPTATPSQAPSSAPTASGSPMASESPAATTVSLASSALGMILVGDNGHTLYGFVPDAAAGAPTCTDSCATTWPPLTVSGTDFTVGSGLDKSNFKLVARPDGSMQLQAGNYPLYFYAPDQNAGDTSGQGVGGNWFVVGSDGSLIGAP